MKKVWFVLSLICLVLVSSVGFATDNNGVRPLHPKVGIVIVGGADFKTSDFYDYIKEEFENKETNRNVFVEGPAVQSQYQNYWLNKGIVMDEPKPMVQDLYDFAKYSGYDKVLYLVIDNSVVEKNKISRSDERTRANIEVKGILADGTTIFRATDVAQNDTSFSSELRAKRGAFQKCLEEIHKQMQDVL